jgi:hypothetical protein
MFLEDCWLTPICSLYQAAWKSLVPAINLLKEMFEYSRELERVFPLLLAVLCGGNPDESLQTQQALARLLADIFDFALRFDDSKARKPMYCVWVILTQTLNYADGKSSYPKRFLLLPSLNGKNETERRKR